MHSQDTINQFITLRAKNISLYRIANQLGISTGTASNWDYDYQYEIARLRHVEMEAIKERHLKTYEEQLLDLLDELNRIDAEVKQRDFGRCSTEFLLYRKDIVKLRLQKLAGPPLLTKSPPEPCAAPDQPSDPASPPQN